MILLRSRQLLFAAIFLDLIGIFFGQCSNNYGDITDIICYNLTSKTISMEVNRAYSSYNNYYDHNRRTTYAFINSSIDTLPQNVFNDKDIRAIYANASKIANIECGAFLRLDVEEFYLQFNILSNISRGCFNSVVELRILDLSNNFIELIEDSCFDGSNELMEIFLNNNKISQIPIAVFESLNNLNLLNLANNHIKRFDFFISNVKVHYRTINLSDNKINVLECKMLSSSYFKSVYLENNVITSLDVTCFPVDLQTLDLMNNNIGTINNLSMLTELKYLNLGNNTISLIKTQFYNLTKLEYLNLQHNKLSNLSVGTFKDLSSLTLLNLSSNMLTFLDFGTFNGLENLETLDISHNNLTILEEDVLHNLNHLTVFNVGYNNLGDINLEKLKRYFKPSSENQIDVIGNNIPCQKLSKVVSNVMNFEIKSGPHHNVSNVNGIPCSKFSLVPQSKETFPNNTAVKKVNDDILLTNRVIGDYLQESQTQQKSMISLLNKLNTTFIIFTVLAILFIISVLITIICLIKIVRSNTMSSSQHESGLPLM